MTNYILEKVHPLVLAYAFFTVCRKKTILELQSDLQRSGTLELELNTRQGKVNHSVFYNQFYALQPPHVRGKPN
jgi:hypothetical protein